MSGADELQSGGIWRSKSHVALIRHPIVSIRQNRSKHWPKVGCADKADFAIRVANDHIFKCRPGNETHQGSKLVIRCRGNGCADIVGKRSFVVCDGMVDVFKATSVAMLRLHVFQKLHVIVAIICFWSQRTDQTRSSRSKRARCRRR